jgi:hypothetical protein
MELKNLEGIRKFECVPSTVGFYRKESETLHSRQDSEGSRLRKVRTQNLAFEKKT